MTKKTIDLVESGNATIISSKTYQWVIGILVTLMILFVVQGVAFGIWKGTIDEQIKTMELSGTALSKKNHQLLQSVVHNQKIMMTALGLKWESLE